MSVETACEKTVAIAAPSTPVCNTKINRLSSRMFSVDETTIARKGVLLSPRARRMQEQRLYDIVMIIPPNIMQPYRRLSCRICSDVRRARSAVLRVVMLNTVSSAARKAESLMDAAADWRRAVWFSLPQHWAMITEKPFAIPCRKPMTSKISTDILPTAASASSPRPLPTMTVSANV